MLEQQKTFVFVAVVPFQKEKKYAQFVKMPR